MCQGHTTRRKERAVWIGVNGAPAKFQGPLLWDWYPDPWHTKRTTGRHYFSPLFVGVSNFNVQPPYRFVTKVGTRGTLTKQFGCVSVEEFVIF